jgi:hypothetical protein
MKRFLAAAVAALLLTSCATPVTPEATGGSRADGTVRVSFEYGYYEIPVVDWSNALSSAQKSCSAWGYSGAQKFGGQTQQCEQADAYGECMRTLVTVTYQCTGHPSS